MEKFSVEKLIMRVFGVLFFPVFLLGVLARSFARMVQSWYMFSYYYFKDLFDQ